MSYYRKVRSSHSIYHPGISLSHEPTYNQKKGMILTRSTNLPQPVHKVVTAQSLRDDARQAVKSGYVKVKNFILEFRVDHENNEWSIDEDNIKSFILEQLGPSANIIGATVTQFSFDRSSTIPAWPDINYTLNIDNASHAVTTTHASSTSGFDNIATAVFSSPSYIVSSSGQGKCLFCPRFQTASTQYGYAKVVDYMYRGLNVSNDMYSKLDALNSAGFNDIPYCAFGDICPYPISTVLSFDASTVPEGTNINLIFSCNVYYIK